MHARALGVARNQGQALPCRPCGAHVWPGGTQLCAVYSQVDGVGDGINWHIYVCTAVVLQPLVGFRASALAHGQDPAALPARPDSPGVWAALAHVDQPACSAQGGHNTPQQQQQ